MKLTNSFGKAFTYTVVLLFILVCSQPDVFAKDSASADASPAKNAATTQAPEFLRVPVFFVTDRNLQKTKTGDTDFGGFRKYIGDCKHDPFMGSAYTVVPNFEHKQLNDHLKSLGWTDAEKTDKFRDFKVNLIWNCLYLS